MECVEAWEIAGVKAERDVEKVFGRVEEGTSGVKERGRDEGFH